MDLVDAELRQDGTPLPRIPPQRGRVGFEVRYKGLSVEPELVMAAAQDALFATETGTAGYIVANNLPSNTSCRCCWPAFSIWATVCIEITYPLSRIWLRKSGAVCALRILSAFSQLLAIREGTPGDSLLV